MSKRKLEAAAEFEFSNRKRNEEEDLEEEDDSDLEESSDEEEEALEEMKQKQRKTGNDNTNFKNKQRVLIFCSRGTTTRYRHLMNDLRKLLPHSKREVKMDNKDPLYVINEICELRSCNNCIYLEVKKKTDCYMWVSKTPNGPSARFHVSNVHTLGELKLLGNCLRGSRPFLLFDKSFDEKPHWQLLKEMFTQSFGTPRGHPGSKPFVDHIFCFYIQDNRIWFRNYQVGEKEPGMKNSETELVEIGPRFVLNPIRIFGGSFGGPTLYQNSEYVSPNAIRASAKEGKAGSYVNRIMDKQALKDKRDDALTIPPIQDYTEDVFQE